MFGPSEKHGWRQANGASYESEWRSSSKGHPDGALVKINNMFPVYTDDYLRRAGGGCSRGIRTNVQIKCGVAQPQQVQVTCEIKNDDSYYHSAMISISLLKAIDFTQKKISPEEDNVLETVEKYLPHTALVPSKKYEDIPVTDLQHRNRPEDYNAVFTDLAKLLQKSEESLTLPECVMAHKNDLTIISFKVPRSAMTINRNRKFNEPKPKNGKVQELHKDLCDWTARADPGTEVAIQIIARLPQSRVNDPHNTMAYPSIEENPWAIFFGNSREGRQGKLSDIKLSTISLPIELRPEPGEYRSFIRVLVMSSMC